MSAALAGLASVCALACSAAASAAEPSLLLNYASTLSYATQPDEAANRSHLAQISHRLQQDPAPAQDCAHTLGAARFAAALLELGYAREALGDLTGAIDAYQRALGCRPHALYPLARLAQVLMNAGRYAEARTLVLRGLARERANLTLASILSRLDFLEERWSEAIPWLRWTATAEVDEHRAAYWECFLWLAQRRANVPHPQLVSRPLPNDWPSPLLAELQLGAGEETVLRSLLDEPSTERRREELVEALYYVGELRLAQHQTPIARRYFAAAVNLKVPSFLEHYMALAELNK